MRMSCVYRLLMMCYDFQCTQQQTHVMPLDSSNDLVGRSLIADVDPVIHHDDDTNSPFFVRIPYEDPYSS